MSVSCKLQIDNNNNNECYRPGEVIKGLVILNVGGANSILIKGEYKMMTHMFRTLKLINIYLFL